MGVLSGSGEGDGVGLGDASGAGEGKGVGVAVGEGEGVGELSSGSSEGSVPPASFVPGVGSNGSQPKPEK